MGDRDRWTSVDFTREREIEILCDGDRVHSSKGGGIEVEVVVLVKLFIIIMGRRDDVDSLVDFLCD